MRARRSEGPSGALNRWALLAIPGLLLLNASLTFSNVWPTPMIQWEPFYSVELAVVVLLVAAWPKRAAALSKHLLPALWILLVIGHYVDVTYPGVYGRELNIYWDSQHFLDVAAMLIRAVPARRVALAACGVLAVLALAFILVRVSFASIAEIAAHARARIVLGAVALFVLVGFIGQRINPNFPTAIPFADPVSEAAGRQTRLILAVFGGLPPQVGESPAELNARLDELGGADVALIFVESYGAITYDNAAFARELSPRRADLAAAVRESGRAIVTAFVESPTFGGYSWFAHLSLLSGVEIRTSEAYAFFMTQPRETIVSTFKRNGFRTVGMMPGIRQAWPEGAFYKFDVIYDRDKMEYTGPEFGWWSIPDQYTLAKLDALEFSRPARPPLFVVFPTGTSHAPFGPAAPFQADWKKVLTPDAFEAEAVKRSLAAEPDLLNLAPSYLNAIGYEYTSIAGYVRQHGHDNLLLVVVGDHQPPSAVAGRDASWDVPVHVIARDGAILDRLRASGFHDGVEARRPKIGRMHELVPVLLRAFGGPTRS